MSAPECVVLSDDSFTEEKEPKAQEKRVELVVISDSEDEREGPEDVRHVVAAANVKVEQETTENAESSSSASRENSPKMGVSPARVSWLRGKLDVNVLNNKLQSKATTKCESSSDEDLRLPSLLNGSSEFKDKKKEIKSEAVEEKLDAAIFKVEQQFTDAVEGFPIIDYKEEKPNDITPYSSPLDKLTDSTKPKKSTPKKPGKQLSFNSPAKPGIFGSTCKNFTQTQLTPESFSPKKLMTEKPTIILDTSPHIPSMHADHAVRSTSYRDFANLRGVSEFTDSQQHFLEAMEMEGFTKTYLETILSYLTPERKPPAHLVFRLIQEYLLKSKSGYLASKCLWTLKRILELHPSILTGRQDKFSKGLTGRGDYLIDWPFISSIVEQMDLPFFRGQKYTSLPVSNATMTLAFMINIMEKEIEVKQYNLRQTTASRLLSVRRAPRNTLQVISWLETCITSQVPSNSSKLGSYSLMSSYDKVSRFPSTPFSSIHLLQRLLQLSVKVSNEPESCCEHLARELFSVYTHCYSLESRSILLQTLQSPLLRGKLTDLILQVTCEAEDSTSDTTVSGIPKIIQHFERMPPKSGQSDLIDECFLRTSDEVEEFVMLVAYSLQSYLFCHHKKLQGSARKSGLADDVEEVEPEAKHLSVLDKDTICNMGNNVTLLHARMMSLAPYLSLRTQQLIGFLKEEHLWDRM